MDAKFKYKHPILQKIQNKIQKFTQNKKNTDTTN